eukprot:110192_1
MFLINNTNDDVSIESPIALKHNNVQSIDSPIEQSIEDNHNKVSIEPSIEPIAMIESPNALNHKDVSIEQSNEPITNNCASITNNTNDDVYIESPIESPNASNHNDASNEQAIEPSIEPIAMIESPNALNHNDVSNEQAIEQSNEPITNNCASITNNYCLSITTETIASIPSNRLVYMIGVWYGNDDFI